MTATASLIGRRFQALATPFDCCRAISFSASAIERNFEYRQNHGEAQYLLRWKMRALEIRVNGYYFRLANPNSTPAKTCQFAARNNNYCHAEKHHLSINIHPLHAP
jgi:hypothetical protein